MNPDPKLSPQPAGPPPRTGITQAEIDRRLDLHTPSDQATRDTLDAIRAQYKALYQDVVGYTAGAPREQAIALHHLEDALQATIAAIVRPKP